MGDKFAFDSEIADQHATFHELPAMSHRVACAQDQ